MTSQVETPTAETSANPSHLQPRRRLANIKQAAAVYPFTEAALRDIVFRAFNRTNSRGEKIEGNGLGEMGGVIRVGRKVLLDLDVFDNWIEARGAKQ